MEEGNWDEITRLAEKAGGCGELGGACEVAMLAVSRPPLAPPPRGGRETLCAARERAAEGQTRAPEEHYE